ncbi:MAG: glycosyltransferase family 4 protein [Pseudorhodobacter sp.]|nr:glycosyltransferase family 4 protein [Pseudorhodobacter sp.]
MSRILMINEYSSTPATGMGGRTHYLSRELARLGHEVTVIAARHHHLLRDDASDTPLPDEEMVDGYRFLRIAVPRYAHAHDKRRILAWFTFAWRLARFDLGKIGRPDVILYSSPSLVGFLGAERLARRCGARLVFEVRDIWPLTLMEIGGYSQRHPFIRFLQWVEDRAYRVSDAVVSNAEGSVSHMTTCGMNPEKFTWVANGFLHEEVTRRDPLPIDLAAQLPKNTFIVGYTGTLGAANSMETLLEAAKLLKNADDVSFVIVGKGRSEPELRSFVERHALANVHFLEPIPKKQIQSMLATFDACFIGWRNSTLYRVGVAANKIYDYLYSGKPILHSYSGAYDPVQTYNAGISVEAENPAALAAAILKLRDMPESERRRLGENGHRAALEHFEYGILARKLEHVLVADDRADAVVPGDGHASPSGT